MAGSESSAACNCGGNHSAIVGFDGPGNGHAVTCPVRTAASMELDPVAHDAVTQGVPIPPADLPPDQRRAYLGGEFCGQRGGGSRSMNPYRDLGCAEAWLNGFDRVRRELAAGL